MQRFVIHEHHASHLHWDLRLQVDRVLKSWAIPKGIPIESGTKRLAIQVVDHPLSYINFEGTITEGYGKGTVKIWDQGTYNFQELKSNKMKIDFYGNVIQGLYIMIKMSNGNWLIYK